MSDPHRRRFARVAIPAVLILLVASQTGWAADDRVFYGLIALFVVVQVFWLIYVFRRQRTEKYVDLLQRTFERD